MDVYVDADEFEALEALLHSVERHLGNKSTAADTGAGSKRQAAVSPATLKRQAHAPEQQSRGRPLFQHEAASSGCLPASGQQAMPAGQHNCSTGSLPVAKQPAAWAPTAGQVQPAQHAQQPPTMSETVQQSAQRVLEHKAVHFPGPAGQQQHGSGIQNCRNPSWEVSAQQQHWHQPLQHNQHQQSGVAVAGALLPAGPFGPDVAGRSVKAPDCSVAAGAAASGAGDARRMRTPFGPTGSSGGQHHLHPHTICSTGGGNAAASTGMPSTTLEGHSSGRHAAARNSGGPLGATTHGRDSSSGTAGPCSSGQPATTHGSKGPHAGTDLGRRSRQAAAPADPARSGEQAAAPSGSESRHAGGDPAHSSRHPEASWGNSPVPAGQLGIGCGPNQHWAQAAAGGAGGQPGQLRSSSVSFGSGGSSRRHNDSAGGDAHGTGIKRSNSWCVGQWQQQPQGQWPGHHHQQQQGQGQGPSQQQQQWQQGGQHQPAQQQWQQQQPGQPPAHIQAPQQGLPAGPLKQQQQQCQQLQQVVQPQAPLQVQQGSTNVIQAQIQIQQGGTFALSHAQPQSQPQVANAQRLQQPAHHISSVHVASGTGVSNSMTPAGMGPGGNGAAAAPPPAAAAASASGRGFSGPSTNASRRKLPSSLAQQRGRGPGSGGGAGGSGGSTRGGAGSGAGGAGSGGCTPQQPQQQQQWGRGPHGPKQLPWSGGCVYACTPAEVDAACRRMMAAGPPAVIGFDLEWKPSFQKGAPPNKAALVQLAYYCQDGKDCCTKVEDRGHGVTVLLLHIKHSGITQKLQEILLDDQIMKLGVNIGGDVMKLNSDYGVQVFGAVDLSDTAHGHQLRAVKRVTANVQPKKWSLAGLVDEVFMLELPKPQHIRMGDWERRPLTHEQQRYAAMDAYACLLLHWQLQQLPTKQTLQQQILETMRKRAEAGEDNEQC